MTLTGDLLIGGEAQRGLGGAVQAFDPATAEMLQPVFGGATLDDLERACALAEATFEPFRATSAEARAQLLEAIAAGLEGLGEVLIARCSAETGMEPERLAIERDRTVWQLRLFADVLRDGGWSGVRIDPGQSERRPTPRPDLRQRKIPLGPVAVYGASNFPLAFSVAGGDSASALAAGCPVIVKAHPAHPGTSELVGRVVQAAVRACGLPGGVFAMLHDAGVEISQGLLADPRIKAGSFTGSRRVGQTLTAIARGRSEPIPFFAEMSSINPVMLLPAALAARGETIAQAFVAALTLSGGQLCTNPGLVVALDGPGLDRFLATTAKAIERVAAAVMLTPAICRAYETGVRVLSREPQVELVAKGAEAGAGEGTAAVFSVPARVFLGRRSLHDEIFGAAALVVRCDDLDELRAVLAALEGQLTLAAHVDEADHALLASLLPAMELKAGRIVINGFGVGVEVGHAMVHGGPYPATSNSQSTSVGALAIERFLRPVCYQDLPAALLPLGVRDDNPLGLTRRIGGVVVLP